MNEKQTKFELYLDEKIAACRQRCERFAADDRIDEGNFEKIRANVYEIFKTIFSAAEKACGKDVSAMKCFFLQKAEQIPSSWTVSYEKAEQHGDVKKMHIESIKLETVREIRDIFMQIWEETI